VGCETKEVAREAHHFVGYGGGRHGGDNDGQRFVGWRADDARGRRPLRPVGPGVEYIGGMVILLVAQALSNLSIEGEWHIEYDGWDWWGPVE
jgi:hypothetical protein